MTNDNSMASLTLSVIRSLGNKMEDDKKDDLPLLSLHANRSAPLVGPIERAIATSDWPIPLTRPRVSGRAELLTITMIDVNVLALQNRIFLTINFNF